MPDRAKFEAMLEALINENQQSARDIFHDIVVSKSRQIYEELLAEDFDLYEKDDEDSEEEDEGPDLGDEDLGDEEDEGPDLGDEDLGDEEDEGPDLGDEDLGDEEDEGPDLGDEDLGDEDSLEDEVMDLKDALEELRAEFEAIKGETSESDLDDTSLDDEESDMDFGDEDLGDEESDMDFGDEDLGDEEEFGGLGSTGSSGGMKGPGKQTGSVYEYVNKVSLPKHGDNGVNTKSPVARPNKMGGTAANIVAGGESKGAGTKGGLLNPSTKEENFGNINKPGANVGRTAFKKRVSAPSASKAAADRGAQSPINGVKSRAK